MCADPCPRERTQDSEAKAPTGMCDVSLADTVSIQKRLIDARREGRSQGRSSSKVVIM